MKKEPVAITFVVVFILRYLLGLTGIPEFQSITEETLATIADGILWLLGIWWARRNAFSKKTVELGTGLPAKVVAEKAEMVRKAA